MSIINHQKLNDTSLLFTFLVSSQKSQEIYDLFLKNINKESVENLDQQKIETIFQRFLINSKFQEILEQIEQKIQEIKPEAKIADLQIVPGSFDYSNGEVSFKIRVDLLPKIDLSGLNKIKNKDWLEGFEKKFDLQKYISNRKIELLLQFNIVQPTFDKIKHGI